MSLCQIYFPIVIGTAHTNFKMHSQKYNSMHFKIQLICIVASEYHENNEVKDFWPKIFD